MSSVGYYFDWLDLNKVRKWKNVKFWKSRKFEIFNHLKGFISSFDVGKVKHSIDEATYNKIEWHFLCNNDGDSANFAS